jgi:drug/metabolite transporter (DMT)-like permease
VAILTEPVGATALAWLLFGELPAATFWVGAPLVLAGVWLAATRQGAAVGTPAVAS